MAITDPVVIRPAVGKYRYLMQGTEVVAGDTLTVPSLLTMTVPNILTINGTLVVDGDVTIVSSPPTPPLPPSEYGVFRRVIPLGESVDIPVDFFMLVARSLEVDGTLTVNGLLMTTLG